MQDKREKVEELKRMALEEGLAKAVREARKTQDPFILDELHDALADELKKYLLERGDIEQL